MRRNWPLCGMRRAVVRLRRLLWQRLTLWEKRSMPIWPHACTLIGHDLSKLASLDPIGRLTQQLVNRLWFSMPGADLNRWLRHIRTLLFQRKPIAANPSTSMTLHCLFAPLWSFPQPKFPQSCSTPLLLYSRRISSLLRSCPAAPGLIPWSVRKLACTCCEW